MAQNKWVIHPPTTSVHDTCPNTTMHKTCCCQHCFTDVEGVSEPSCNHFILTIREPSLAPNSAPDSTSSLSRSCSAFLTGNHQEWEAGAVADTLLCPLHTPSHLQPAAFSGLCCSLRTLVRQPSLAGVKISLRWSWLVFPSLFAKSDASLSRFPGIVGLKEKHKLCKGYW